MDKEQAKFILQSFRPNGEDAKDESFTEALELATEDRELGEWLAQSRALDAEFAGMLSDVEIPDSLRDAVLQVLSGSTAPAAEFDGDLIGALASIQPPAGLRDEILAAVEVERKVVQMPRKKPFFKKAIWGSSIAAVLAVMFAVFAFFFGAGGNAIAGSTPYQVRHSAIEMLSSPFFTLDTRNTRQAALYEWLSGQDLPAPESLPKGLQGLEGIGCKFLEVGESKSPASLICYRKDGEIVHLVMMEKDAVDAESFPTLQLAGENCRGCDHEQDWTVSEWADAEHAFFLLSKMDQEEFENLF